MTTAPTPSRADALIREHRENMTISLWAKEAVDELARLQADNEAMRETLEFVERWAVHHASKPHMTAELALGSIQHHPEIRAITERYSDGKRPDTFDPYARIAELQQQLVAEASATAEHKLRADQLAQQHRMQAQMHAQATQQLAELDARKPLPLSDEQIDAIADGMPGGLGGFMKTWGWRQFARKILDLRAPPTWEPGFDCMVPGQEELVMQFCLEIAGPRGQPGRNPDPVRLLEMAEALYKAEADAHGITGGSS